MYPVLPSYSSLVGTHVVVEEIPRLLEEERNEAVLKHKAHIQLMQVSKVGVCSPRDSTGDTA